MTTDDEDKNGLSPEVLPTEIAPARTGPVPDVDRLEVGVVVGGRYRVDGVLGAGGMGEVYRARDLRLERAVALKTVRRHLLTRPAMVDRFRREAVAVARLRHPNIVTVHDYGVAPDEGAFLVMELLEGRTLRDELRENGQLPQAVATHVARQICRAVAAAHREGVVHRDLKPENVFLETRNGETTVKVVDFGLAKLEAALADDDAAATVDDIVFGTPVYMSPEQCQGEVSDSRSDVYALGCVLFEMLTGRPPFVARPLSALLFAHVNAPPPRPSDVAPGVAADIDTAVLRALAKSPSDRYQRAEDFEHDLAGTESSGLIAAAPPPHSGDAATARPLGNLPLSTSRFVGRDGQIADVGARLDDSRLVTLVGPGGIGKTRLSIEVAARAAAGFDGGAWLVELGAVSDPARVADAAIAALGARETSGARAADALVEAVGDRMTLLVFDNCEHVVEAAAHLVDFVLRACPRVRVLSTSREPLGVEGEAIWPVPPLSLPEPEDVPTPESLGGWEATRLFVERASLVRAGFAVAPNDAAAVAEICRRLDGIPLAVELAAACAKVLSIPEIAARLGDRFRLLTGGSRTAPLRHQTLRAAIAWSHDLLADEERALLRRLSVFSGGFSLEAVESVCDLDGGLDALGSLARLVDASLVVADARKGAPTRYRTYETVREFATETLAAAGESDAIRTRHRDHFRALAERAGEELTGPDQVAWARRLEEEHGNLSAALRRTVEVDADADLALPFACALGRFWSVRGHFSEGRSWLERALALPAPEDHPSRPWALIWSAQLARLARDVPNALSFAAEAREIATRIGDRRAEGVALLETQNAEVNGGLYAEARVHGEAALAVFEEIGDRRAAALAASGLGMLACETRERDLAVAWFDRALPVMRELGDARGTATILNNLGRILAERGEIARARELVGEGLELVTALGDQASAGFFVFALGLFDAKSGDHVAAMGRYREAIETYRTIGASDLEIEVAESVATSALALGWTEPAVRLLGAAEAARAANEFALVGTDAEEVEAALDAARASLGDAAVELLREEGRALGLDRAVADAADDVR